MAWDDLLLPASFRGIPFFVDTHEKNGGRNAVSHEPPDRDSNFSEDMGKKADGYKITGHILGDTYFFIRDSLITAMETREPGNLIHPYLGFLDVQPQGYTFSEDTKEGRICRFELNFIEAGDPNDVPNSLFDSVTNFVSSKINLIEKIKNQFRLAAFFTGLPGFAVDSTVSLVGSLVTTIEESLGKISTDIELLPDLLSAISDLDANKRNLLLNEPDELTERFIFILDSVKNVAIDENEDTDTINTKKDKSNKSLVYDDILAATAEEPDPVFTTVTRQRELENGQAVKRMVRNLALISLSEAAANATYTTQAKALQQRDDINDLLDEQANIDGISDNLFQALKDQKAANVDLIPDPRIVPGTKKIITLTQTTPSIVLAYSIYGDISRETDIIDRNSIFNPAFIDGDVEVVSFG